MSLRIDAAQPHRKPEKLANGFLRVDATISRSGLFNYRNADGSSRVEYRPPSEVQAPSSLASFNLVPFTNDHPRSGLLTSDNAVQYTRGSVGDVRVDGDHVAASILVQDRGTVDAMLSQGKTDVSCGYTCDYDPTPGITSAGDRYDGVQRNIRGNHVALVDRGRAGSAKIRLDAEDAVEVGADYDIDSRSDDMRDMTIKGVAVKIDPTIAALIEGERADAAQAAQAMAKRADTAEARADAAEQASKDASKSRQDAADSFAGRVNARVALISDARCVLGDVKLDSADDRSVRVQILGKLAPGAGDLAQRSDDYVTARCDAAMEAFRAAAPNGPGALAGAFVPAAGTPRSDNEDPEEAARKRNAEENAKRWKTSAK